MSNFSLANGMIVGEVVTVARQVDQVFAINVDLNGRAIGVVVHAMDLVDVGDQQRHLAGFDQGGPVLLEDRETLSVAVIDRR